MFHFEYREVVSMVLRYTWNIFLEGRLGRFWHMWKDVIEVDYEIVNWIHLTEDRVGREAFVMNLLVP
jgi:hypothetical protein